MVENGSLWYDAATMQDASAMSSASDPDDTLSLREVALGGQGAAWTLTLSPDALSLRRVDAPHGDPVVIDRVHFFDRVEYREHTGGLILLAPTRVGLRLDAASQRRLRAWLGPRSRVELEHVIKTQFRTALIANALFVLIALGWNDPLVLAVALGSLATGVAARFAPRAWQLLLSGVLCLLLAARQAWLVAHDQVRSVPLGILVIVGCVLGGIPFLVMYRRFSGVARRAP